MSVYATANTLSHVLRIWMLAKQMQSRASQSLQSSEETAIPVGWVRLGSASEQCHCVFLYHFMIVCQNQPKWVLEKVNYYLTSSNWGESCFRADSRRLLVSSKSSTLGAFLFSPGLYALLSYSPANLRMPWAVCVLMRSKREFHTEI